MKEPYLQIRVGRNFKLPVVTQSQFVGREGRPYITEKPFRAVVLRDGFPLMYLQPVREHHPMLGEDSLKKYGLEFHFIDQRKELDEATDVRFRAYVPIHKHEGGVMEWSGGRKEPMIFALDVDEGTLTCWMRDGRLILDARMRTLGLEGFGTYYLQIAPVIFSRDEEGI